MTRSIILRYPSSATSGHHILLKLIEAGAKITWGAVPLLELECENAIPPQHFLKAGHTATYFDATDHSYQMIIGGSFNSTHPPGIYILTTQYQRWASTSYDNVRHLRCIGGLANTLTLLSSNPDRLPE